MNIQSLEAEANRLVLPRFTETQALTLKFFESSVAKIRAIYKMANRDADNWLKTIMSPMESQVREHQLQLRRRLESIKRIHQASDTLEERVSELEQIRDGIREQERNFENRAEVVLQVLNFEEDSDLFDAAHKTA